MEPVELMPQLLGERVRLVRYEKSHAVPLFQMVSKERERLSQFLLWPNFMRSLDDELTFISGMRKEWDERRGFGFAVTLADSGFVIGTIGVRALSWVNLRGEIGYWLGCKHEGKGYITEAVSILEKHLFDVGFNRIEIHCDQNNIRSKGVPVRLGYLLEGTLRDHVCDRGGFRNIEVYGKISSDIK